jgi:hypothetical protein
MLPPTATAYWLLGLARRRRLLADVTRAPHPSPTDAGHDVSA